MSIGTIVLSLVLVVPTVYWVRLRLLRLQPVMDFISILPFVVPPIVLVIGLLALYREAPQWFVATPMILLCGYVIHALPYVYRSVDTGMQAINIHTLTEAVDALFTASRPALTADATGLIATSGAGTVYRLDAATGEVLWRASLPDEALLPMGPYRKSGPVVASGPTVTERDILQGTCGGLIYRIDPTSGEAGVVADLGAPVAAPLASIGDDVIVASADGVIHRLPSIE